MRQSLVLLLSFGALILLAGTPAQPAETDAADHGIELAQQKLSRVTDLVAAGALPRVRIDEAQADLDDAKDELVLAHALYGDLPEHGATEQASAEMIAAAQRRVDRQQVRLDGAHKMVNAGVAALSYLVAFQAELTARLTTLDVAHLRARLMADRVVIDRETSSPVIEPPMPLDDTALMFRGMEHYEGDGAFNEARDLPALEFAFSNKFARPLPISAEGETNVHRGLGFDHRGRVDVALVPSGPEGTWLRQYLKLRKIPYYAFSRAIAGEATGAHIHIGPGSTHLGSGNQLSKRFTAQSHTAN